MEEDHFRKQISNEKAKTLLHISELDDIVRRLKKGKEMDRTAFYIYSKMRLPIELWERIFLFAVQSPTGSDFAYALSHVCQFWRTVALRCSHLWANVNIGRQITPDIPRIAQMVHRALSFSSHYCLNIRLGVADRGVTLDGRNVNVYPLMESYSEQLSSYSTYYPPRPHGYEMLHMDTVEIEAPLARHISRWRGEWRGDMTVASVMIFGWRVRELKCVEVIPDFEWSPRSIEECSLSKLSLVFRVWPDASYLEPFFTAASDRLQELELEDLGPLPLQSLNGELYLFSHLHTLRISIGGLTNNMEMMRKCPKLRRLGIYDVLCAMDRTDFVFATLIENEAPELIQSVTHFEAHTVSCQSAYSFHSVHILLQLQAVDTLEVRGPYSVPWIRRVHQNGGSSPLNIRKLVFREVDLTNLDIVDLIMGASGEDEGETRARPLSLVKGVVLDHCTGITRRYCDNLRQVVDQLDIYCL